MRVRVVPSHCRSLALLTCFGVVLPILGCNTDKDNTSSSIGDGEDAGSSGATEGASDAEASATKDDGDDDSAGDGDGEDEATGSLSPAEEEATAPFDCDNLPPLPATYTTIVGPGRSEDFSFSAGGSLLTISEGHLISHGYDGTTEIVAPSVLETNFHGDKTSHGLVVLPGGDIVFGDSGRSALVRVTPNGGQTTLLEELPFPNGIAVDREGRIYVTVVLGHPGDPTPDEISDDVADKGVVIRVDPDSGEYEVVADTLTLPNGLAFGPSYAVLYIGSHMDGGFIYALDIASGQLAIAAEGVGGKGILGTGSLDGISVDRCGNIYATEIGSAVVWRVSPDGQTVEKVVDLSSAGVMWVPSCHFGSGRGGWGAQNLYVVSYEKYHIYEIPLGVPGVDAAH
ncbi:MAG: SMP-30/gluconolactonase/LRE family protein [Nannocystaceae bacterium]